MVEDNPGDARLVQVLLNEQAGERFCLRHVESIDEAQRMIEDEAFDAVLLDLSLPDSYGIDSLEALQSLARDLPIVVLSGNDDDTLAEGVFARGAQDYLNKGGLDGYWLAHCLQGAIKRHRAQMSLRDMAFIDELTGLFNRRGFLKLAELEIKRSDRAHQDLAVFFLDMDGLKQINDTRGHLAGDHALRNIATLLKESFRDTDIVARVGGDEFAVLTAGALPDHFNPPIGRLTEKLQACNLAYPHTRLSVSEGVVHYDPMNPQPIEALLAHADARMYEQKRRKKTVNA